MAFFKFESCIQKASHSNVNFMLTHLINVNIRLPSFKHCQIFSTQSGFVQAENRVPQFRQFLRYAEILGTGVPYLEVGIKK